LQVQSLRRDRSAQGAPRRSLAPLAGRRPGVELPFPPARSALPSIGETRRRRRYPAPAMGARRAPDAGAGAEDLRTHGGHGGPDTVETDRNDRRDRVWTMVLAPGLGCLAIRARP